MRAWLDRPLSALPHVATRFVQRPGPMGLEIGNHNLHLCQLGSAVDGRYPVLARSTTPYSGGRNELLNSPQLLKKKLRQAVRGKGFRGNRIVTALPPDRVRFTPLTIGGDEKDVPDAVLQMVSDRVEGRIQDYVVDYLPVRTAVGADERLALAAIARREHVMAYLEALSGAGFIVDALDIGPAAIRRTLSSLYQDSGEGEVILVVNTGATHTYLSVIAGRRLLLDQAVAFGEDQLLEKLAKNLDLSIEAIRKLVQEHGLPTGEVSLPGLESPDELDVPSTLLEVLKPNFLSLIEEINRVLIYSASETRGRPMDRIFVLGGLARWSGFAEVLCELVGVSACGNYQDLEDCFLDHSRQGDRGQALFPEMSVAVGLALRGLVADG